MKDKLLFIALVDVSNLSDGVSKKVKMQAQAFDTMYDTTLLAYNTGGVGVFCFDDGQLKAVNEIKVGSIKRQKALFKKACDIINENSFIKAYIRYPYSSPGLLKTLRALKGKDTEIVMEIPTYPLHFDKATSIREFVSHTRYNYYEFAYSGKLKKYVHHWLEMGKPVVEIYGIPAKNVPNGVDLDSISLRKKPEENREIHFLVAARFVSYHGVDRVLMGLADYYRMKLDSDPIVILEVAGDGPEMQKYREIVAENGLGGFVNFYGFISGRQYEELYNKCQVACSSLATHRCGIEFMSPLKAVEYIARGIPFICSYRDVSIPSDFKYSYQVESNEEPINIPEILQWVSSYQDRQDEVAKEMRAFCHEHFTWEEILKNV